MGKVEGEINGLGNIAKGIEILLFKIHPFRDFYPQQYKSLKRKFFNNKGLAVNTLWTELFKFYHARTLTSVQIKTAAGVYIYRNINGGILTALCETHPAAATASTAVSR